MKHKLFLCLALVLSCVTLSAQDGGWSRTMTPEKQDTLVVTVDPGDAVFLPWQKKELVVKANGLTSKDYASIGFTATDKAIRLDYRGDRKRAGKFKIYVPANWNLDIYVHGNVGAKGRLDGKLGFKTENGSISLGDTAGDLSIDSLSGDVALRNLEGNGVIVCDADLDIGSISGDLTVKNIDGDTSVESVGGRLNAQTEGGDISVGEISGNAVLQAQDGDIDVRKLSGAATLTTGTGDIALMDASGMVVASSDSGDIELKNISGAVDARTEAGSISAELHSGNGNSSRFYSKEGEVTLLFPPQARATVEVTVPENEEEVVSDFKPAKTERRGNDMYYRYLLNGGGDTVRVECAGGEVQIRNLATSSQTRSSPPPASKNP